MNFDGGLGTDLTRRFTGDINEPLPGVADGAAFRLNFMVHDCRVAQRDVVTTAVSASRRPLPWDSTRPRA